MAYAAFGRVRSRQRIALLRCFGHGCDVFRRRRFGGGFNLNDCPSSVCDIDGRDQGKQGPSKCAKCIHHRSPIGS